MWNPDTEKWENKDGTEETSAPVGPPPKMPQLARGLPPSVSRNTNRSECTRHCPPPPASLTFILRYIMHF